MSNSNATLTRSFSFKRAWAQVKQGETAKVKQEIMDGLNLTSPQSFLNRLNGDIEPRVSEADTIEGIFNKYGITEIWGE